MTPDRTRSNRITVSLCVLLLGTPGAAQFWKGGESVDIKRMRPADVHLANSTMMVQVSTVGGCTPTLTERLKKLIINGVLSSNRTIREVSASPQILIECSITRCEFHEKTEKRKLLGVKDEGTYKTITFTLEASYKVARVRDNYVYLADNVTAPYKKEFRVGVDRTPDKPEIEDSLMSYVLKAVLSKLTNTEETQKVRLMGKDNLNRYARLAQGGQWLQYLESISSLPEKKPEKDGRSEFEGDRNYDLCLAYEALAYANMWKDYEKARQYFDLADSAIRKAQQFDPREKEYVNAQTRLLQGKKYFEIIEERFPHTDVLPPLPPNPPQPNPPQPNPPQPKPQPNAMTNQAVINMLRANLSEDLIIETIRATQDRQFDTSPNGLIQLATGGVSERIIRVITSLPKKIEPKPKPPPRRKSGRR